MQQLARRLSSLTLTPELERLIGDSSKSPGLTSPCMRDADAIISHIEVNHTHGVGVLLQRLFSGLPNILSIRSADYHGGVQTFGDAALRISHECTSRDAVFSRVLGALGDSTVRRVLCVPYFPDDVRTAVAVQAIYGAGMCTYLMDDQNVSVAGIPDSLMGELLSKSALRLTISPELRWAYETKYGLPCWYLPPLVTGSLISSALIPPPCQSPPNRGVLIGNIWGQRWMQLLRATVRRSGVTLAWYSNGHFRWTSCSKDELIADSIVPREPPPDQEMVRILRQHWFAVVPTGTMGEEDDRGFLARLSLPSRIVYLAASSQVPILVLGSAETAAAHFVKQFGIGIVANYDRREFEQAVATLTKPEINLAFRQRALAMAGHFSADGAADWIWDSLARGIPADERFERLMPERRSNLRESSLCSTAAGS